MEKLLERQEFERCLKIGLGRVIVYLQDHDAAPYHDLILYACLNNTTYDTQFDGYKTDYMMEIINLTDNPDYYREKILKATQSIADDDESWQAGYLIAFTTAFAKQGDSEARQIIYDHVNRTFKDEDSLGVHSIIEIDSLDGFVYVMSKIAPLKRQEDDPYWYEGLLWELKETMGEAEAKEALEKVRKTNQDVNDYLSYLEDKDVENKARRIERSNSTKILTYAEIKKQITHRGISSKWGEEATKEDLLMAAEDLVKLDDPILIARYLRIFQQALFPLNPELLFSFMNLEQSYPYPSIPAMTISILQNLSHSLIREFALQLIDEEEWAMRAVGLLAMNFEDDDWQMIEIMSEQRVEDDLYHSLGFSVQHVFKQHPDSNARQTLLNIYEYGPCMGCRKTILEMLATIDAIPDYIRNECMYDANEDIQNLAQSDFVST